MILMFFPKAYSPLSTLIIECQTFVGFFVVVVIILFFYF